MEMIDLSSAIRNDTPENMRQKELEARLERRKLEHKVARMRRKVDRLKAVYRDTDRLMGGKKAFCNKHHIWLF